MSKQLNLLYTELDHLQHIHNALNAIYDKLTGQGDGIFDIVAEEFEYR